MQKPIRNGFKIIPNICFTRQPPMLGKSIWEENKAKPGKNVCYEKQTEVYE
jgi:hypothetical protein